LFGHLEQPILWDDDQASQQGECHQLAVTSEMMVCSLNMLIAKIWRPIVHSITDIMRIVVYESRLIIHPKKTQKHI
jgi:hypothetical protein